ncbi:MAG: hypothetical protein QM831_37425 [Kofleriaceae bacterium]
MGSVMCIVSKPIFEKAAGKEPELGTVLGMDKYVTTNKALNTLSDGGNLYLVTVRKDEDDNEALWLVGVLVNPEFDGSEWSATASTVPLTDITSLRSKIKYVSGKGMSQAAGALAMSLQTPRELSEDDIALLDATYTEPEHEGEGFPAAPDDEIPATSGERRVGDALVHAIIDDPYNAGAREIYADALSARNDERGTFIRTELALAGPLAIRHREQMKRVRDDLFAAHAAEWFPVDGLEFRTSGGFIYFIRGNFEQIVEQAELFDTQPIVEADIKHADPAKLVRTPWLRRIRELALRNAIGDQGLAKIIASPNAQQLVHLNVTHTGLKAPKWGAFLPNLRTLVLTANALGSKGAVELAGWQHLPNLETLYLSGCNLSSDDVATIFARPMPNLVKLTLASNKLDNKVAGALTRMPKLEVLELDGNKAVDKDIAKALPKIRRVDTRGTKIKVDDAPPGFRAGPFKG